MNKPDPGSLIENIANSIKTLVQKTEFLVVLKRRKIAFTGAPTKAPP